MTLDRLIALRDDLSDAIAYESQNRFLLNELVRIGESNARLLNALHQADADLRSIRTRLADRDLEIRRLKVALEVMKHRAKVKRRTAHRKAVSPKRLEKAL